MLFLQSHHIVDLYCWIDEQVPPQVYTTGRPPLVTQSEMVTMLLWGTIVLKQKTLKDMHRTLCTYHSTDFTLPKYSAFVSHAHHVLPLMFSLLELLLSDREPVRLMDATMVPVCKNHRAESHKIAKGLAQFGKNWQGWHYGFKLHASTNIEGVLCGIALTSANVYDAQVMVKILNTHCVVAVGDTLYGARVMGNIIKKKFGTIIIAPPWPTQKKKVATSWQIDLLNQRSKIECVFDFLKEHMQLVSSFPRSVAGYVLHYARILLSYQIMALSLMK